mgnify:CR=1 FL=1
MKIFFYATFINQEDFLKAAKKKLNYHTATKSNIVKPKVIWLDDQNHTPIGLITIK